MAEPWCVQYATSEDGGGIGWCATFRNKKPDPLAQVDKTACGKHVILRIGSGMRQPTCVLCEMAVRKRGVKRG